MKIKTTLAAFILVLSPVSAFAYSGCQGMEKAADEVTMSCAEGSTFDTATNTCVADTIG